MSLDKAIQYGKEYRKKYFDSRSFDPHCRNNERCSYCRDNRLYSTNKRKRKANYEIKEWIENPN